MTDLDLCYLPALQLAELIRSRSVSPVEVIENSLRRIDEVNPTLNGFCFVYQDEAMAAARQAEAALQSGRPLGPLHGVPIAIKDLTPTRGKRTTLGSRIYEQAIPDRDSVIVERLLAAGAILVGKTTTPELAYSGFCSSPLWGRTLNPWDLTRTSGGSSGGSAVAVATGCVALAEGSDMGGSVRIPACFCGIVGLKPSFGRIPCDVLPSGFDSTAHFGPLARTIDDAALFLNVTQGPDDRDIQSLPPLSNLSLPISATISGLRIAASIDLGYYSVDPDIEANTRRMLADFRSMGATADEIECSWSRRYNDALMDYWAIAYRAYFQDCFNRHRDQMDPNLVAWVEDASHLDAAAFKRIDLIRTELWQRLRSIFERYDAFVCPTAPLPPPLATLGDNSFGHNDEDGRYQGFEMTGVFNLVPQCPALSVPSGFTTQGLPTGLQIVGPRFADEIVLRIGAAALGSGGKAPAPPVQAGADRGQWE
jgi:Asp-tRNA(Asn)/Glu-tRNA(Gln) amidotransferase A subunit family amidase